MNKNFHSEYERSAGLDKIQIKNNILNKAEQKKSPILRRPALVICIIAILLVGTLGACAAVEISSYNKAVKFFDAYELSTEGMTRGEIKSAYRDITTEQFRNDGTIKIIQNNVGGYEITQDGYTSEEVESLWNLIAGEGFSNLTSKTIGFETRYKYKIIQSGKDMGNAIIRKYKNGKFIWETELDFSVRGATECEKGLIVYGKYLTENYNSFAQFALIDNNGKLVWHKILFGEPDSYTCDVIPEDDYFCAIMRWDMKLLVLGKFDYDGNPISYTKNEIGNRGIDDSVKFGDGYLVRIFDSMESTDWLVKLDKDGNIVDKFSYTVKGENYRIVDMIEYGGKVYISAYAYPIAEESKSELYTIRGKVNFTEPYPDVTSLIRDYYTAVLLVCDANNGTPTEFYSVKSSLGGLLTTDRKGNLVWRVQEIVSAKYSIMTSAYSVIGETEIFNYTYNKDGELLIQEKTGEQGYMSR